MRRLILTVFSALSFMPAFSQTPWSGNVALDYGSDFEYLGEEGHNWKSNRSSARGTFKYTGKKYFLEFGGDGSYKYHISNVVGLTIKSNSDADVDASITVKDVQNIRTGAFLKTGWELSPSDKLDFSYVFRYSHDIVQNRGVTFSGNSSQIDGLTSFQGSSEDANSTNGKHTAGLNYEHLFFKPGRVLTAGYELALTDKSDHSDWYKVSTIPVPEDTTLKESYYRITPRMLETVHRLKVKYAEKQFAGVESLNADFELKLDYDSDRDFQRASTLVGTEWRDSTSYNTDFFFDALTFSPIVHLAYSKGVYGLDASYTPQYYTRRLSDSERIGTFDYGFISHLVTLKNLFDFHAMHKLALNYDRSVNRPGYLQVCWFERAGPQYSNVLYEGDPNLMPEGKHQLDLSYTYTRGRFSVLGGCGYEYKFRTIEQTYYEDMRDKEKYRIYTWINGGIGHTVSVFTRLAWNGGSLKAKAEGKYNYFHGISDNGNETLSSDYSMLGEITYSLKKWTFLGRLGYESKIVRSYTSKDELVKCDIRVDWKVWKFTLFLEGLDLLDRPIEVATMNETQTEERYEQYDYAKRLFQAGLIFKF